MRRTLPFFLLTLALFTAQCAARAAPSSADYTHAPGLHALLHWERFPLRVFFPVGRLATRERKSLVLAGFDEWVRATHSVVRYQIVPAETQADITITFAPHSTASGSPQAGGWTTQTHKGTVLTKAAVSLTERDEDPQAFQAIAAHEFGHALGIDGHSDDAGDIMFPVVSFPRLMVRNDETDPPFLARTVTRRDVNTLQAAYPGLVFTPAKR